MLCVVAVSAVSIVGVWKVCVLRIKNLCNCFAVFLFFVLSDTIGSGFILRAPSLVWP